MKACSKQKPVYGTAPRTGVEEWKYFPLQRDGHGHSDCLRGAVAAYLSDLASSALFLCAGGGGNRGGGSSQSGGGWAFWRPLFRRTFGLEPWWRPLRLAALLVEKALGPGCGIREFRHCILVTAVEHGHEHAIRFTNSANLFWSPRISHPRDGEFFFTSSFTRPRRAFFQALAPRFSPSDASLTARPKFASSTRSCRCFAALVTWVFPIRAFAETGLISAASSIPKGCGAEVSAIRPPASPSNEYATEGNSPAQPAGEPALGEGVYLLVLSNGGSHAATDYWVTDRLPRYRQPRRHTKPFPAGST